MKDEMRAVFTGGGTAGHIYPGLAVCEELKKIAEEQNINLKIFWIGSSKGMDKKIVTGSFDSEQKPIIEKFYGIPSGKLRRYFSFKNFIDLFKIAGGFISSIFIIAKIRPKILFSKGGFVSVPPCLAGKILKVPVFIHECDFTMGLANKINSSSAKKIFLSYEATKNFLSKKNSEKSIVTGNPVRPSFYNANAEQGFDFLKISKDHEKPILLILGGSSGAKQINSLVSENIDFLCDKFIVVHQTGLINSDNDENENLKKNHPEYFPYEFIYDEMPSVLACCDVVLSRAGANSIWETAVLKKPMVLIPLSGSGTRGDQVDNANFFKEEGAAEVLLGDEATGINLCETLSKFVDAENRKKYLTALEKIVPKEKPARLIAKLLLNMKYEI